MQEWTRLKEDDNGRDLAFSLVVDSELFRVDSVVRWLDAAEGRLRRALADGWTPGQPASVSPPAGEPKLPRPPARPRSASPVLSDTGPLETEIPR